MLSLLYINFINLEADFEKSLAEFVLTFVHSFPTDEVFGPNTNMNKVFKIAALPLVEAAMQGVNGMHCLFIWLWDTMHNVLTINLHFN